MYTVIVKKEFTASHQLNLAEGGLEELHEHRWIVEAAVSAAALNERGMAIDFHVIERLLMEQIAGYEGKCLENCEQFKKSGASAEAVAREIFDQLAARLPANRKLAWVEVTEAPNCRVRYTAG